MLNYRNPFGLQDISCQIIRIFQPSHLRHLLCKICCTQITVWRKVAGSLNLAFCFPSQWENSSNDFASWGNHPFIYWLSHATKIITTFHDRKRRKILSNESDYQLHQSIRGWVSRLPRLWSVSHLFRECPEKYNKTMKFNFCQDLNAHVLSTRKTMIHLPVNLTFFLHNPLLLFLLLLTHPSQLTN